MKTWIALAVLTLSVTGCDRTPNPPAPTAPPPTAVPAPVPTPEPANEKLQAALALKREGKLADARAALLALDLSDQTAAALNEIDTQILFTATPAPEKVDYTIQAGDALGKLAQKYGTTIELIRKANNITGDKIRIGDRLRIYQGKFAVEVSKTANTLTVTDSGKFFKRYRVGTGQFAKTPVGEFKITSRIENPPWYRSDGKTIPFGDPENILGTHWLGLNAPGYGIHGTWDTNSIGKQASAGCVRLLNDEVAELYIMLPIGTPVTIHD
jgi:lipoprotein-anchoring transpeptidase ErfK/SrfK